MKNTSSKKSRGNTSTNGSVLLTEARKEDGHRDAVKALLNEKKKFLPKKEGSQAKKDILTVDDFPETVGRKEAASFLIRLTMQCFLAKKDQDIVLMSFGLLQGYEKKGIGARRLQYYFDTEGYREMSHDEEEKVKDSIRTKETGLFRKMEFYFVHKLHDKAAFLSLFESVTAQEDIKVEEDIPSEMLPIPSYLKNRVNQEGSIRDLKVNSSKTDSPEEAETTSDYFVGDNQNADDAGDTTAGGEKSANKKSPKDTKPTHKSKSKKKKSRKKQPKKRITKGIFIAALCVVVLSAIGIFVTVEQDSGISWVFGSGTKGGVQIGRDNNGPIDQSETTINQEIHITTIEEPAPKLTVANREYEIGQDFFEIGQYQDALKHFDSALAEHDEQSYVDIDTARIQYAKGITYRYLGRIDDAIDSYTEAIGTLDSLEPQDYEIQYVRGYVYYLRASAFIADHQLEKAQQDISACDDALTLLDEHEDLDELYTKASVYNLLGNLYTSSAYSASTEFDTGEDLGKTFFDARVEYNNAIYSKGIKWVDGTTDGAISMAELPFPISEETDNGTQTVLIMKSLAIVTSTDAETAEILVNRATLFCATWDYELAEGDCMAALKIFKELPLSKRTKITDVYFILAYATLQREFSENGYLSTEGSQKYLGYLQESLSWNEKWSEKSFETAKSYENMGFAYETVGQYPEAIENFENAKQLFLELGLEEDAEKQDLLIESCKELQTGNYDAELVLVGKSDK